MALSVGIVGLPNVGKSTLFNALSNAGAESANYPFCTIDPNVGVVPVPDPRQDKIVAVIEPQSIVPTTIEFLDIAGLVKGASKGEGLGNQFLSHIRMVDAICHVVRVFEDDNVVHVDGKVDPASDIEVIDTELLLRDIQSVEQRRDKARKQSKGGDPEEKLALATCEKVLAEAENGTQIRAMDLTEEERKVLEPLRRLILGHVGDEQHRLAREQREGLEADGVDKVVELAKAQGAEVAVISAAIEAEIAALDPEDRADFLDSAGLEEPGLHQLIRKAYALLDLLTFFTAGKKEVRAWTVRKGAKAPQAAGRIHTDFERGFIKAEVMRWEDLVELGSEAAVKAKGLLRIEGKEYVVADGDVIHFRFNV